MNAEYLQNNVERLESAFSNILYMKPEDRIIAPDMNILGDIKNIINNIFNENTCINVIYTHNTDKQFFGIRINPAMSPKDAVIILGTDDQVRLNKYRLEFDSKLFEMGLDESELAALTIYEISSMMDSNSVIDNLRSLIDYKAINNDTIINIRDSVNYAQLVIFAIKDTMTKLSSFIYKDNPDDLLANYAIHACNREDDLLSANEKITNNISGFGDSMRSGKTIILDWLFTMIQNMKFNSNTIIDTLKDAKEFTSSRLEKDEIEKTINSIDHIDQSIAFESKDESINKFFDRKNLSTLNEVSIFKNLKKNGLRGLENELYEYAMRVKNCSTSEDAYLIMRGLNSRIGILEDYIANENLSDYDLNHWTNVCNKYRELRDTLSKKKFKEKNYGLWYDYSQFDNDNTDNN